MESLQLPSQPWTGTCIFNSFWEVECCLRPFLFLLPHPPSPFFPLPTLPSAHKHDLFKKKKRWNIQAVVNSRPVSFSRTWEGESKWKWSEKKSRVQSCDGHGKVVPKHDWGVQNPKIKIKRHSSLHTEYLLYHYIDSHRSIEYDCFFVFLKKNLKVAMRYTHLEEGQAWWWRLSKGYKVHGDIQRRMFMRASAQPSECGEGASLRKKCSQARFFLKSSHYLERQEWHTEGEKRSWSFVEGPIICAVTWK